MDLLLQLQADQLGVAVRRPRDLETTALGAAYLAGLAEGVWPSLDAIAERWQLDVEVAPDGDRAVADAVPRRVAPGRRALPGLGPFVAARQIRRSGTSSEPSPGVSRRYVRPAAMRPSRPS